MRKRSRPQTMAAVAAAVALVAIRPMPAAGQWSDDDLAAKSIY